MDNFEFDELLEHHIKNSQKEKFDDKEAECYEKYLKALYEEFKNAEIKIEINKETSDVKT